MLFILLLRKKIIRVGRSNLTGPISILWMARTQVPALLQPSGVKHNILFGHFQGFYKILDGRKEEAYSDNSANIGTVWTSSVR